MRPLPPPSIAVCDFFATFAAKNMKQQTTAINQQTDAAEDSLLFICLGNICRSPAAEGITKKMLAERGLAGRIAVDSAGIGGWHVGQLPDSRMRRHGAAHGYNFDSRARQFSAADFSRFSHIVVMDEENYKAITRMAEADRRKVMRMACFLRHHPGQTSIPDPYYGGESGFELVIELLEDACEGLIDHITNKTQQA